MLNHYLSIIKDGRQRSKFEEVYHKHKSTMYHAAYALLQDQDMAEDAVYEALIRVANNMPLIERMSDARLEAYLVIIARSAACKLLDDQEERSGEELEESFSAEEDAEEKTVPLMVEEKIFAKRLMELINSLEPMYMDVLILKYYHDETTQDIAAILGISEDNVNIRLFRARKKLKKLILEEELYDGSPV